MSATTPFTKGARQKWILTHKSTNEEACSSRSQSRHHLWSTGWNCARCFRPQELKDRSVASRNSQKRKRDKHKKTNSTGFYRILSKHQHAEAGLSSGFGNRETLSKSPNPSRPHVSCRGNIFQRVKMTITLKDMIPAAQMEIAITAVVVTVTAHLS